MLGNIPLICSTQYALNNTSFLLQVRTVQQNHKGLITRKALVK